MVLNCSVVLQSDQSDDELEHWEVKEIPEAVCDLPAADIPVMEEGRAERLNGYIRNQYCGTAVKVSNLLY